MLGTLDVREADFGTFVGGTTQQREMFCIFGQLVDSSCCVEGPLCIGLQCCLPYYSRHGFSKAKVWHTSIDAYYLFFSFLLFGSGQDLNGDCCFLVQLCGCFFLCLLSFQLGQCYRTPLHVYFPYFWTLVCTRSSIYATITRLIKYSDGWYFYTNEVLVVSSCSLCEILCMNEIY